MGLMESMVSSIDTVKESSTQIARIVSVIDDIAFQTNLLALNAAVEAARAGKFGKGFSVVATEVRNLAARSAKAAQETSTLIKKSVDKIEESTKMAKETRDAIQQIVSQISELADHLKDIDKNANEQSDSLSQIKSGIKHIEQSTLEITARAQQTSDASQILSNQADSLNNKLTEFRVNRAYSTESIGHNPMLGIEYDQ
jgi:methyl-accepting chemotaxis protein